MESKQGEGGERMMNYYSIEKGTKAYEYLDKTYNQDTDAFFE